MDYILSVARESHQTGAPMVRPLWWSAPDDSIALSIDSQFMLGNDLMVAPVQKKGAQSKVCDECIFVSYSAEHSKCLKDCLCMKLYLENTVFIQHYRHLLVCSQHTTIVKFPYICLFVYV